MERLALILLVLNLLSVDRTCWAAGAGRAFPIDSENFAISVFKGVNPSIEWDPTNFLVDLSGQYANCNYLNKKGEMTADRKTPEGATVTVVIDTIEGKESDVNAVNKYVGDVLRRWQSNRQYHRQIQDAKRVGCSVRPACSGSAVIACVFSSGAGATKPSDTDGHFQVPNRPPTEVKDPWDGVKHDDLKKPSDFTDEKPKAQAFTPDQYKTAESIMGKTWDRSHFLENLSGFETDCGMIGRRDWPFEYANKMMRQENIKITHQYGSSPNKGSTPDALREILSTFKPAGNAKAIGCSVIPHCRTGSTMQVVVACLYEEN